MYARVYGAQTSLLTPTLVSVETDLSRGLHSFTIVGLPDKAVEESRDRVAAAIKHSGFTSPKSRNQKIVISLAPADLRKEGPLFDVPIALSYLLAAEDIRFDPDPYVFIGELSLDGTVQPVRGVLSLVSHAKQLGKQAVFVPVANAKEAALVEGIVIYGVSTLQEIVAHVNEKDGAKQRVLLSVTPHTALPEPAESDLALEDIRGQYAAKRAAIIAAAGGHNLGLSGPPGTGKTMLARAVASLLPPLSFEEALEVNAIHSIAGTLRQDLMSVPPFRSPHHTASYVSIVGGGANPRPGEVTLAHRGVLFLDEFPEFERRVVEALRQPLEDRVVSVARARGTASFPARFSLVAAMNPCPCGNWGSAKACVCPPSAIERYRRKMSGPIADRIDLWAQMGPVAVGELGERTPAAGETARAKEEILGARQRQRNRYGSAKTNSDLSARDLERYVPLAASVRHVLNQAAERMGLSPRAYHRVMKVARTIADLRDAESVEESDALEALQYRTSTYGG